MYAHGVHTCDNTHKACQLASVALGEASIRSSSQLGACFAVDVQMCSLHTSRAPRAANSDKARCDGCVIILEAMSVVFISDPVWLYFIEAVVM